MTSDQPTILVTGGAGYIGSHTVLALKNANYDVVILDNLEHGHRDLLEKVLHDVELVVGDISDRSLVDNLFASRKIDAVIHFAAYIAVGESVSDPAKYYRNNVSGTLTLLEAMMAANVNKFVFSSTCAIYGEPKIVPIPEEHPRYPISPYATSKLMVEEILADFDRAYNFKSVRFRFFNAAGAHPEGILGEDHHPETHLIPLVLQTALGRRESVSILGTDYPTPDGTGLRDYIHVNDIAAAHILGLEYLLGGGDSQEFNLGNGCGFSVREVIESAKQVTGRDVKAIECERRPGDPPILVGSSNKVKTILGWKPQYPDLEEIIAHAWQWHQYRHG